MTNEAAGVLAEYAGHLAKNDPEATIALAVFTFADAAKIGFEKAKLKFQIPITTTKTEK